MFRSLAGTAAAARLLVLCRGSFPARGGVLVATRGSHHLAASDTPAVTLDSLDSLYTAGTPITMITAYDYPTALLADTAADITLVGDLLAQVARGYSSTTDLPFAEFEYCLRAAARGNQRSLLMADMPHGLFEDLVEHGVRLAIALVKAGAQAVKIEGGAEQVPLVRRLTAVGIPVMGHVGLTPQRAAATGYRVQGRLANAMHAIVDAAQALQQAGCFLILVECVPSVLGEHLTQSLAVPTIGIGAGPHTSGQVLVVADLLGQLPPGPRPKFVKQYGTAHDDGRAALARYADDVRLRRFPAPEHTYKANPAAWSQFLK